MSIDYKAANALFKKQGSTLTRRLNKARKVDTVKAWQAVYEHCVDSARAWDDAGYPWPDNWHRYNVAASDAQVAIARLTGVRSDFIGLDYI